MSVELVIDKLDEQLGRRRRELVDLRMLAADATGVQGQALRRASHLMAYAHWEGFAKFSLEVYLQYICDRGPAAQLLRLELQALNLLQAVKSVAAEGVSPSNVLQLMQAIDVRTKSPFAVRPRDHLRTGNLSSSNFRILLNGCALEYLDYYALREKFIDEVLCGRRHRIAHGELEPVTTSALSEVVDGVIGLCDQLNEQLQNALVYDHYFLPT